MFCEVNLFFFQIFGLPNLNDVISDKIVLLLFDDQLILKSVLLPRLFIILSKFDLYSTYNVDFLQLNKYNRP